jgi:hypothetical protein
MRGVQEIGWFALLASVLAGLNGLAPDPEGSPQAPGFAVLMFAVATVLAAVLVVDRHHQHHDHHHRHL